MRVVVVYKNDQDYTRIVDDFLADFARQTGRTIDVLDPESTECELFCGADEVVEYTTIIALSNDGQLQKRWIGAILPTINEVIYYVSQD